MGLTHHAGGNSHGVLRERGAGGVGHPELRTKYGVRGSEGDFTQLRLLSTVPSATRIISDDGCFLLMMPCPLRPRSHLSITPSSDLAV